MTRNDKRSCYAAVWTALGLIVFACSSESADSDGNNLNGPGIKDGGSLKNPDAKLDAGDAASSKDARDDRGDAPKDRGDADKDADAQNEGGGREGGGAGGSGRGGTGGGGRGGTGGAGGSAGGGSGGAGGSTPPPPHECEPPGAIGNLGGCGLCGISQVICGADFKWGPASCNGQGVCLPGQQETAGCGNCGAGWRDRICGDSCQWGAYSNCHDQPPCNPGDTTAGSCECNGTRYYWCNDSCNWEGGGCVTACGGRQNCDGTNCVCVPGYCDAEGNGLCDDAYCASECCSSDRGEYCAAGGRCCSSGNPNDPRCQ